VSRSEVRPAARVAEDATNVFLRILDLQYPLVVAGEGVRLRLGDGTEILDACSGGAMVTCLGHGVPEVVAAAAAQAEQISYMYAHFFTNEPQEELARRLVDLAPGMARVRFVSGGSEANETMMRLARQYHVERGEPERWRFVSPAQAYHGATMGTLSLTGRLGLQSPFENYLANTLHIGPLSTREDPDGTRALGELDRVLEDTPESVAAFVCEPVGAAAQPAATPADAFWQGLDERRRRYGFLVCFDEVVAGIGRTGTWFAYEQLPIVPDIVTVGKGLGAGYAPLAATLCQAHVFEALAAGSMEFEHGHTWDGAPLPCAVGLAVLDQLVSRKLVERVRARGPRLRDELEQAVGSLAMVREVRGRGFLLGVELVDPRDGRSLLPPWIDAAELVDDTCERAGLLVTSSHSSKDGMVGDQTLLAPAFCATDTDLAEMVERFANALAAVERTIMDRLAHADGGVEP
jgi:adenosylmethionine-8-amino-7-oxononanoate aminotransferase